MGSKVAKRLIGLAQAAIEQKRTSCLLRTECVLKAGYTLVHLRVEGTEERKYRAVLTHRFIFEALIRKIPDGLDVLHSCDTPGCFNPLHLFDGRPIDNSRDMVEKRRHPHGEKHYRAKITESDVVCIRELCNGGMLQAEVAKPFAITPSEVSHIFTRRKWKYVA